MGRESTATAATIHRAVERQLRAQQSVSAGLANRFANDLASAFGSGLHLSELASSPAIAAFGSGLHLSELASSPAIAAFGSGQGLAQIRALPFGEARATALADLTAQVQLMATPPAWWSPLLATNLSNTSQIAADLATMTNATVALTGLGRAAFKLEKVVGQVLDSHHRHLASAIADLMARPATYANASLLTRPTSTTASFTRVARDYVVPRVAGVDRADLIRDAVMALAADLEAVGAPQAAQDLRDGWNVVRRRDPGWSKAGAHLIREALRSALDELAPPRDVPPDDSGRVTKRSQVLWIVGDNETLADWVTVTASNVGPLHSLLSAEAKNSGRPRVHERGLLGLLQVAMGLLTVLAEQAADRGQR